MQTGRPGVYIEELPSSVRTSSAVTTPVTAFVGHTRRGPLDQPLRIIGSVDSSPVRVDAVGEDGPDPSGTSSKPFAAESPGPAVGPTAKIGDVERESPSMPLHAPHRDGKPPHTVAEPALHVEESLYHGLRRVAFEPNGERLWQQIRLDASAYPNALFRQSAFRGATPREAYFAKCDRDTTTDTGIERGVANVLVGIAPVRSAEFVIDGLRQTVGRSEVREFDG